MVADSEVVKRKLRELKVVDLRNELERRNLDKSGVKATLLERLSKALQDEGHDTEEFVFEIVEKKAVGKRISIGKTEPGSNEMESIADEADALGPPMLQENYIKIKEDPENKESPSDVVPLDVDVTLAPVEENKPAEQVEDSSMNHENNDGAEDFINLNLEEEEEFGEEEHHTKEKDETSLRMDSNQQQYEDDRSAKSPSSTSYGQSHSSGGGPSGATPVIGSSTRNDVGRDEDQNRDATESNKGAGAPDQQGTSSTASPGDKVKSGSVISKDGFKSTTRDDREKKKSPTTGSRNLWVSGLSTTTRATDLKHLFSKFGKVVGAKVVTNARTPGARCYGYVTMSTSEEATECIQRLNRTELHGRMISVERAKGDGGSRKTETKSSDLAPLDSQVSGIEKSESAKADGDIDESTRAKDDPSVEGATSIATCDALSISSAGNAKDNHEERSESAKDGSERGGGSVQRDRPQRDWVDHDRRNRPRRPSPHRPRQVLTHKQIKEEHDRQRLREREREEHRAERRRQEELARLREHERRQREEAFRLEKERERLRKEREQLERERLRFERERLEREKAELQRLEREHRLEREKAEAEELRKRSFTRIDDARRAPKRPGERDDYYGERKRITVDSTIRYDGASRFEDNSKPGGHFGGATSGAPDYRGAKVSGDSRGGFESRARFDRSAPAATSGTSTVTRRVVQEVPAARRDVRPHSPPPPRERSDDRRVIDRGRDDRYDRGNRGRDSYGDRDQRRDRERPRDDRGGNGGAAAEPIRNRIQDRDHRERYDSRSGKDRYNERGSDSWQRGSSSLASTSNAGGSKGSYSGGGSVMGNGSAPSGSAWNNNVGGQSDRWATSPSLPINRMSGGTSFNNSWTGSVPPLTNAVFNAPPIGGISNLGGGVMGQSGSVGYSGDRYSSRH